MVHYASAYTGYGPIKAGPTGLSYLTLRAIADFEAPYYLPQMRSRMKPLPKVNRHSHRIELADDASRRERKAVSCEVLIPPVETGAGAWMLRIPPDQVVPAPRHGDCGGQFRVVIAGSMEIADQRLARLGCAFVDTAESELPVVAGSEGLDVIVLQFPSAILEAR
jgi:hypothetical protein